ncbi:MAG: DUF4332 domain-containing protein [Pseudomonadota bacterium]
MTLLEIVILAHRCRSTHHYIAFDALQLLSCEDAGDWKNLLLKHHMDLIKGSKAPDNDFKDFQNHVLHVQEGEWGGARDAAMQWYGKAVEALRAHKWGKAAYALGVMSHYYSDVVQPLHTGQTEEEGVIHRAFEWSVTKSRSAWKARIDAKGYPRVEGGPHTGFVADMVLEAAKHSNPHYQTCIDHYDIRIGAKKPEEGLDNTLLDLMADLLAYATAGIAHLFERAFAEAAVSPPKVDLDLPGYLAALDIPARKLIRRVDNAWQGRQLEAMLAEFEETGKVLKTLPKENKVIRKAHAEQVLRVPVEHLDAQPLNPVGSKHVADEDRSNPVDYVMKIVPVAATPSVEPVIQDPTEDETVAEPIKVDLTEDTPEIAVVAEDTQIIEETDTELFEEDVTPETTSVEPETEALSDEVTIEADESEPESTPEPEVVAEIEPEPMPVSADSAPAEETEGSRLTLASPVVDAPSIGPKTAKRLEPLGILTIGDLLDADPAESVKALDVSYITLKTFYEWQDQTRLMLGVPGLRVLDAQILVGAGVRSLEALQKASAATVFQAATTFLGTPGGSRVLWGAENTLEEGEVADWIERAKDAA